MQRFNKMHLFQSLQSSLGSSHRKREGRPQRVSRSKRPGVKGHRCLLLLRLFQAQFLLFSPVIPSRGPAGRFRSTEPPATLAPPPRFCGAVAGAGGILQNTKEPRLRV